MTKTLNTKLVDYLEELLKATKKRDEYEIEYELVKAKLMVSKEIDNLSNQSKREAEIINLLDKKGMYRKMAELKMHARLAWYKWESVRNLLKGE
jgi:hypothetical protein